MNKPSFLFYKYFLSYLLVVFIALLFISIVVYGSFINTLQNEVESSNTSALMQVKNNMDTRLKEIERTALHMYTNPRLKPNKMLNPGYDSIAVMDEIKQYKSGNEFISDIVLYQKNSDKHIAYSTQTDMPIDVLFDYGYQYENWSLDEFLELTETITAPVIRPVESVIVDRVKEQQISTYIYPLPTDVSKPTSFILFMIDNSVLNAQIKDVLKDYSGYIFILDKDGLPIVQFVSEDNEKTAANVDTAEIVGAIKSAELVEKINKITIDGESYSIVKVRSDYNQWSYISVMQTKQLFNKVYSKKTLFNLAALAILLLGCIIAYTFARGNYKPLKNLINVISKQNLPEKLATSSNEYSIITNVIIEEVNKNKWLMAELQSKAGLMKAQILKDLLHNRYESLDEINGLIMLSGLKFDHPQFLVLVFFIDDYKLFEDRENKQDQKFIKFSIVNIIEELSDGIGHGYAVELENERKIALLLNIDRDVKEESPIPNLIAEAKNFFSNHFGITLTIGVGNKYNTIQDISESFLEADRAVYFRLLKGNNNVIFYKDIQQMHDYAIKYPSELENKLIIALKQGKIHEIREISIEIVKHIELSSMTPDSAQFICYGVITSLIKSLNEMEIDAGSCFGNELERFLTQRIETIDDLGETIIIFCDRLCAYLEQNRESKNFELRDRLLFIIEENYCDNMLSIESLAEKVNISKSYMCRYFKDQTGYSIMQYIDMLRIVKVKEMLRATKLPLSRLIAEVGYLDESSFIRKFKQKEGLTPMQYRTIVGK